MMDVQDELDEKFEFQTQFEIHEISGLQTVFEIEINLNVSSSEFSPTGIRVSLIIFGVIDPDYKLISNACTSQYPVASSGNLVIILLASLSPQSQVPLLSCTLRHLQVLTAPPSSICIAYYMLDGQYQQSSTMFVNIGLQNGVLRTVLAFQWAAD
jgi:hypothetical protein